MYNAVTLTVRDKLCKTFIFFGSCRRSLIFFFFVIVFIIKRKKYSRLIPVANNKVYYSLISIRTKSQCATRYTSDIHVGRNNYERIFYSLIVNHLVGKFGSLTI